MCKYKSNEINKYLKKNNIINTIFSNYINIWKVHYYTLPKILYFELIFRINITFLYRDRVFSFGDRVFTEFFPISSSLKLFFIPKMNVFNFLFKTEKLILKLNLIQSEVSILSQNLKYLFNEKIVFSFIDLKFYFFNE